jgi:hypothetical protein
MALLTAQRDVEEVQQIYLNHYRVLFAANDPMMQDSLDQAYAIVMDQAGRIADEERRLPFLENVKANQEIEARVQ